MERDADGARYPVLAAPLSGRGFLPFGAAPEVLDDAPRGWTLVRHEGLAQGGAKVLPGRVNNYLPTEWRLRKSRESKDRAGGATTPSPASRVGCSC
jgi:hypothetical protein